MDAVITISSIQKTEEVFYKIFIKTIIERKYTNIYSAYSKPLFSGGR